MEEAEAKRARLRLEAILRDADFDLVIEMARDRGESEQAAFAFEEDGAPRLSEVDELLALVRRAQTLISDLSGVDRALTEMEGVDSIVFKPDPDGRTRKDLEPPPERGAVRRDRPAVRLTRDSDRRRADIWILENALRGLEADALA